MAARLDAIETAKCVSHCGGICTKPDTSEGTLKINGQCRASLFNDPNIYLTESDPWKAMQRAQNRCPDYRAEKPAATTPVERRY